ncbi:hypothetical protein BDV27DRAFT_150625 [Aspergillus caelatus]|uniref:C2H2-type domain-containing protein n=1 Tax=Aspergillus caelatus TaxID=61420 RepID=A0A5N6ZMN2_9EURO|nr:uncharacterized protein BDV27DRAFT_150625 [Aspergillus caelatus]KAE8358236.1 hypothetical protein BDV27DRAFT_150625 [Aspergillus caelatus]
MAQIQRPETLSSIAQKISNRFLINETQRFELWAKNLGLYHLGHSSLDYRFRDAPSLFEFTVSLLRNLEALLVQRELDTPKTSVQPQEQFSDDSEEDDFGSSDDESIIDLLLSGVAACIDKLYRLSFKIRNPAMRLGFSKALKYRALDPETGVDLIDQFRESDQRHLEQLFASYRSTSARDLEKDFLVQRLAKANTRRRQQFAYWKKRRGQFETMSRMVPIEEMAPDSFVQGPENGPNLDVPVVPTAPSQPSTATHLDVSKVNLDDDSSVISISRTHILRDLRPYLCTYEDCKDADQQYDSLSDWINHETITHQSKSNTAYNEKREMSVEAPRKCPFCLEDAGPHHIATHLRRVACFSLPRSVGDAEDGDSFAGTMPSKLSPVISCRINSSVSLVLSTFSGVDIMPCWARSLEI